MLCSQGSHVQLRIMGTKHFTSGNPSKQNLGNATGHPGFYAASSPSCDQNAFLSSQVFNSIAASKVTSMSLVKS